MGDTILESISSITELNDMHEFLQDEKLDKAMHIAVKLSVKQDIPPQIALNLMLELQATSMLMGSKYVYYKTLKKSRAGTEDANKAEIYRVMRDSIDKLVDTLKYVVKVNG